MGGHVPASRPPKPFATARALTDGVGVDDVFVSSTHVCYLPRRNLAWRGMPWRGTPWLDAVAGTVDP